MASNDELIYYIKFQPDEQSLSEAKRKIDDLEKAKKDVGSGEATERTREYTEAVDEMNESNAEGIERLIELQEQIDQYRDTLKEIRAAKRKGIELNQEERTTEAESTAALKRTRQEYRNTQAAVIATAAAAEGKTQTYNELVAENRNLAAAMKDIPLDDTSGQLDELKARWEENNTTLKEFDASMGDHRRNVGNYSEAMSTAASAVAAIQGPLGPIAGRINSINTTIQRAIPLLNAKAGAWVAVKRAMIATGIGAIIVALGAILGALKGLQPVMDQITLRTKQLGAAWGNFRDMVGSWFNMNERANISMRESVALARELHRANIRLQAQQILNITTMAELEAQVAALRREAEDEMNTHEERLEMMNEAIERTQELFDLRVSEQEEVVRLMQAEIDMAVSTREEIEELQQAKAELIRLRAQEDTQLRQLVRRRTSITNSLRVEQERRQKVIEGLREEGRVSVEESEKRIRQMKKEAELSLLQERQARQLQTVRQFGEERVAIELETQFLMQEAEREFTERREEAIEASNEHLNKQFELYRGQGLSIQEANNRAAIDSQQQFTAEMTAIEERLADDKQRIREREQGQRDHLLMTEIEARNNVRDQVERLQEESAIRQTALERSLIENRNRQIIELELQREMRARDLEQQFLDMRFSEAEARRLAEGQAELEYEEQLQQTKNAIRENATQQRLEMEQSAAEALKGIMGAAFGDSKEVRMAQAIIDTYTAVNRALASADPPLSYLRAASALAMGMANVRAIQDTKPGSSPSGSSMSGAMAGANRERAFEIIDRDPENISQARSVAMGARPESSETSLTLVMEGDLDSEIMAIKVREGNKMINTKTVTTKSRA